jgi:hypothetical protein
MTARVPPAEVEILGEEALRSVVVRVENQGGKVQLAGVGGDLVSRNSCRCQAEK